jgi:hypothetical protein
MKTVDSSLLTMQKQQLAAYSGSSLRNVVPYNNGQLLVNPILDISGFCPKQHDYTQGYSESNRLSQGEGQTARMAGCTLCGAPDYSIISPGVNLLNCNEVSTIRTSYDNNALSPLINTQLYQFPSPLPIGPLAGLYFNGNGFLQVDAEATYSPPTTDFTIEFYIRPLPTTNQSQVLFYVGTATADETDFLIISLNISGDGFGIGVNAQSATQLYSTDQCLTTGKWQHVAIVRIGTDITVYTGGVSRGTYGPIEDTMADLTSLAIIGAHYNTAYGTDPEIFNQAYTGYISNFRWTKGLALYKSRFVVPKPPLEVNSSSTRLLLNNSSDPTIDSTDTGQVITNGDPLSAMTFDPVTVVTI